VDRGAAFAQYKIVGETCDYPDPTYITHEYIPSLTTCDYLSDPVLTTPPNNAFTPWNVRGQFLDTRPPEEKHASIPVEDRPTGPDEQLLVSVEGAMPFGKIELKYPDVFDKKDIPDLDLESAITVVVADAQGEVVPGRLHLRQISASAKSQWFHIYWRSDASLHASSRYSVVVTLDNKAVAPCPNTDHLENINIQFDVNTRDSLASAVTPVVIEEVALEQVAFGPPREAMPQTCCVIQTDSDEPGADQICWQQRPNQRVHVARKTAFHTFNGEPVRDYIFPGNRYLVDIETKELSNDNRSSRISARIFSEQIADEYCVVETAFDIVANEQLVSDPVCITNDSYSDLIAKNAVNLSKIDACANATPGEKAAAKIALAGVGYVSAAEPKFTSFQLEWRQWISKIDGNDALDALESPHCDFEKAKVVSANELDTSSEKESGENEKVEEQSSGSADGNGDDITGDDSDSGDQKTTSDSGCGNAVGSSVPLSSVFLFMLYAAMVGNRSRRRSKR